jgi:hypothetical protein
MLTAKRFTNDLDKGAEVRMATFVEYLFDEDDFADCDRDAMEGHTGENSR